MDITPDREVPDDGLTETLVPLDAADADTALALLDRAEATLGVPLVDESERTRLETFAAGDVVSDHWHGLLAARDGQATGYAGMVVGDSHGGDVSGWGDVAVDPNGPDVDATTRHLLLGAADAAEDHEVDRLRLWIRHAGDRERRTAEDAGFGLDRRLDILGRDLARSVPAVDLPAGTALRTYEPGVDDGEIVAVLAAAYAGTPDGGWDEQRFSRRRAYQWFDPDDLLVAVRDDQIVGLHWTKRRGGDVGEVYNLAVHPAAQGGGLGRALLRAGLRHLADRGCRDVLLWVDAVNEPARRLYVAEGFIDRWSDLSLVRQV